MFGRLGPMGLFGLVVLLAGVAVIGVRDPLIAAGVGMVLAGLGLVTFGAVRNLLSAFGMR